MNIIDKYITGFNFAFRKQEFTLASDEPPAENILKLQNLIRQRHSGFRHLMSMKGPGFAYEVGGAVEENNFRLRHDISPWPYFAPLYIHMKGTVEAGASPRHSRIRFRLESGVAMMIAPLVAVILISVALAFMLQVDQDVFATRVLMGFFMACFPLVYWLAWQKYMNETPQALCSLLQARVENHRFCSFFTGK